MHRTIKAIVVAGAIVMSLATGTAGAQAPVGWNLIRPTDCFLFGGASGRTLRVYTSTFSVNIVDPFYINIVLQWCSSGLPFYGYNAGVPATQWTTDWFWFTPGLK